MNNGAIRRPTSYILNQTYTYFKDTINIPHSINLIAEVIGTTWRTTKSNLETLCDLGILERTQIKNRKRTHYVMHKKVTANCEVTGCIHNNQGYCEGNKGIVNMVVSYGRSTDYAHVFLCEDMDPREAMYNS